MRRLVSESMYAKKDRNWPSSADQVLSTTKPPPSVPPSVIMQNLSKERTLPEVTYT